jgi:thiosulfate/3-mercaptopyruvate sulfurtransferase
MMPANGRLANPEIVVTTEWVEANVNDPDLRLVAIVTAADHSGHIPGAIVWRWTGDNAIFYPAGGPEDITLTSLLEVSGIAPETVVVLYGDSDNRLAIEAYHRLKQQGHEDVRLMEGGRQKWLAEARPVTAGPPAS